MVANPDPNDPRNRRSMVPHVDQLIRQAISMCWMALPDDRRSVDEVEKEVRRLVDRAIRDMREDFDSFGLPRD